jgi:hypothetical protein
MKPGQSHAGITIPQGDPGAVRAMAGRLDQMSGALEAASGRFGTLPGRLSTWQGPASVSFALTAADSRRAAAEGARSFALQAGVARRLARGLEEAQADAEAAIEDAKDAERRIEKAQRLIDEARQRRELALLRAAAAELAIAATDIVGPASQAAIAERTRALDEAAQAADDEQRAQRMLERAQDDLEQARRRGSNAEERAQDHVSYARTAFLAVAPAPALAPLGSPATGVGGQPVSPLAGYQPLVPLPKLHGERPGRGFPELGPLFTGPAPFGPLPIDPAIALAGSGGGLTQYGRVAGQHNRMLRSFHARGLGSLGNPLYDPYLLSPEARAQADRMRGYHASELSKAQEAGDDISKLRSAGKLLGPAGDALDAKLNADEGMPVLENILRTGGSWGLGTLGAAGGGILCAGGGPVAAGGCGAVGAVGGGEAGDSLGGLAYDGLDWGYQNAIKPLGELLDSDFELDGSKMEGQLPLGP